MNERLLSGCSFGILNVRHEGGNAFHPAPAVADQLKTSSVVDESVGFVTKLAVRVAAS
jgi:hypothetical protein